MIKLLPFLIFIFTFVPIRAVFENAGKHELEVWEIDKTQIFERVLRSFHYIYYIVASDLKEESRIKMVKHIIELWKRLDNKSVKLIRKTILSSTNNILDIIGHNSTYQERLNLRNKLSQSVEVFENCLQPRRLYKLSRESDKFTMQIPILNGLTLNHDFLLECDSNVLIFNMINKKLTEHSKRLAYFIGGDDSYIFPKIWPPTELVPEWFRLLFTNTKKYKTYLKKISSNNTSNFEQYLDVELTEYSLNAETTKYLGLGKPLSTRLNSENCYILQNNLVREITVFIGNNANFQLTELCLTVGEQLAIENGYVASVVQEENLTASFLLVFESVLDNFPQTLQKPASHIMNLDTFYNSELIDQYLSNSI